MQEGRTRMYFCLVISLLFGGFTGQATGAERQLVTSVQVLGLPAISEARAKSWLVTRPGMPIDSLMVGQDLKRLLRVCQNSGYWQAKVEFSRISHTSGKVVFRVEPGAITRIGAVHIEGNVHVSLVSLNRVLTANSGTALIGSRLEGDLMDMLALYSNAGYPYCKISPLVNLVPGQDTVSVQYSIAEGPLVTIDAIRFTGNRATRKDVLLRQMRIRTGERFNQERIDRGMRYLRKLSFLLDVDEPVLAEAVDGSTTLVVGVREAPSGRMEGGLGYAPRSGGPVEGLTGVFALEFDNFMGTARSGKVLWGRQGPSTSHLGLSFREPWVLGGPISIGVELNMQDRPAFAERRLETHLEVSPAPGTQMRAGVFHQQVTPDSSGFGLVPISRIWGLTGSLEYDSRDDRYNPRKGLQTKAKVAWGSVGVGDARTGRTDIQGTLGTFLQMGRQTVVAAAVHGAIVHQAEGVPQEARFRIGGSRSIRGQREEAFLATQAGWANLELRYLLGRRSRVFLFVDGGLLNDPLNDGRRRLLTPMGFGGGIRARSGLGMLGLDYGLGKGDGPAQGKIHVRMVNEF